MEAPLSGSREPAEDGTLLVLAAAEEETAIDQAQPVSDAIGKATLRCGSPPAAVHKDIRLICEEARHAGIYTAIASANAGLLAAAAEHGLADDDIVGVLKALELAPARGSSSYGTAPCSTFRSSPAS